MAKLTWAERVAAAGQYGGLTFGLCCPVCGEYRGLGAATDMVKPCADCVELVADRARLGLSPFLP